MSQALRDKRGRRVKDIVVTTQSYRRFRGAAVSFAMGSVEASEAVSAELLREALSECQVEGILFSITILYII
jgi:hypothetical protein